MFRYDPSALQRQIDAERPTILARQQVTNKYAEWVQSCIQITEREANGYKSLIHRSAADVISKYIPECANTRAGIDSMLRIGQQQKLKEAATRYPDFWSSYKVLTGKFDNYNTQHEAFAKSIRASKNLQEADSYASQMQQWHNNLTSGFHLDLDRMIQKFEVQLKSVCQPIPLGVNENPVNLQPIGNPNQNTQQQGNQSNSEVERLTKMLEDIRQLLNDSRVNNAELRDIITHKNTVITNLETQNTDLQVRLTEKDVIITELNGVVVQKDADILGLNATILQKDGIITGLNQNLEQEHVRYDELREQYDVLLTGQDLV